MNYSAKIRRKIAIKNYLLIEATNRLASAINLLANRISNVITFSFGRGSQEIQVIHR